LTEADAGRTIILEDTLSAVAPLAESHPGFAALLTDISDPDPVSGQISKAFASRTAYERWGRHYIPCVMSSLRFGWAINFKDALSRYFGNATTRGFVARGDAIFTALPPPRPSYSNSAHGATAAIAAIHNSGGACFLPDALVTMFDGSQRRCDDLHPGDRVAPHGYRIRCVVRMEVPYADVVKGITQWHPVFVANRWQHPAEIGPVERVVTDAVYNFVLEDGSPHTLIVNGMTACGLGHDMRGPVIGHPYFGACEPGKRNVRDDLEADPGWAQGRINWRGGIQIETDPATGWVCGMRPLPV
jgi:hypothetical protein